MLWTRGGRHDHGFVAGLYQRSCPRNRRATRAHMLGRLAVGPHCSKKAGGMFQSHRLALSAAAMAVGTALVPSVAFAASPQSTVRAHALGTASSGALTKAAAAAFTSVSSRS